MDANKLIETYRSLPLAEQRRFDELHAEATGHRKSAQALAGSLMGSISTQAKAAAARRNGALGGRPRKKN
jgi:hypothetical protein